MSVVENEFAVKNDFPKFIAGDTVTVHYKIVEGNKERIQQFRGVVLQRSGSKHTETFTVVRCPEI
jgi:large subunit ribosomal protein L19